MSESDLRFKPGQLELSKHSPEEVKGDTEDGEEDSPVSVEEPEPLEHTESLSSLGIQIVVKQIVVKPSLYGMRLF